MNDFLTSPASTPEEKLFHYHEQMEDILHWAGLGTWSWSIETGMFEVGAALIEHYGYAQEEIKPLTLEKWGSLIHPEDVQQTMQGFQEILDGKTDRLDQSYRISDKIGRWIWFHVRGGVSQRDDHGKPIRLTGTIQDITKIKGVEAAIRSRDRLLAASNESAKILLEAFDEDFDRKIWRVLDLLGTASNVDRVYIWKNHPGSDGRLYTTQIHEWSLGAEPQQGNALTVDIPFEEAIPTWEETLTAGRCVNNLVRLMPQAEQDQLAPQGIVSILVAPIVFKDEFWGFIGFDDCTNERTWNDAEEGILKSAGMLIASAVMRRQTEQTLASEQEILKRIFETSPVGVVITTDGVVRRGNRRFFDLLQIEVGESVFPAYASPEGRESILREIREKGAVFNRELSFRRHDGAVRDFLVTYQKIDFEGQPSLLCWTADITELKETEKALVLARDQAEGGTRAKSEFLARMSHEIRTPMNAILGMTYLCLQTELTEKQRDYLLKTQTATTNLLGIIDDILDFSKIEAGKLELEQTSFRLSEVLRDVVDMVEFRALDKGLKLTTRIGPDVCENLLGDPLRLRQILLNLVNNAVKFTDRGEIVIAVEPDGEDSEDDHRVRLKFSVRDTGIGMTKDQVSNLFKSFSQADGSTTRKYGGTGLGLAITKNLIEIMGGHIHVESRPDEGTLFYFAVPILKSEPPVETDESTDLSQRRILVADDDPAARDVIRDLLQSLSVHVDTVDSGEAALAALNRATLDATPYDLLLLDWKMPRMDGIETIRRIREDEQLHDPPKILMISAYDRSECLRQSRGLGLTGFLVKPVTRRSLRESMLSAFHQRPYDGEESAIELKHDLTGARVLLVEDNKINQMVAAELLQMIGVETTVAGNGVEAVEAVQRQDFDLILMDIQMPVMDGLEAAEEIRKLPKPGVDKLPILAMTANATDVDYQKSLGVGMNDHLTKPIDPEKLRKALETWIVR